MENMELDLKLSVKQINVILKYLGAGTYGEVADIISSIHEQSKPQIQTIVASNSVLEQPAEMQAVQ